MGKSAPSPPPAPDYAAAAAAQGTANVDAARTAGHMNNPNIVGPYGSQTVTWGEGDQPTITQQLTPEAQGALQDQQGVQHSLADLAKQGVGTAQNVLGTPFQYSGPGINTSAPNVGNPQTGPKPGDYGYAQGFDPSQYGQANAVDPRQFGQARGVNPGMYGMASGVGPGQQAQGNLDLSGVAKMPVNGGMTAQNAILSRLNPQIQQNEQATATRLANQGLTPGSEAWNNEMRAQGNQENDLYTQAALQGIGVDMSANQQGYGQALNSAGLYNAAVSQNFGQNLAASQSRNAAIGQNLSAALSGAQSRNSAIAQNYGMSSDAMNQRNSAIGQNASLGMAGVNANNAAVAQNYGIGQSSAGLYNNALAQQFGQGLAGAQFGNTAAQQDYQMQLNQYNQPLNQIAALMSGSQINVPSFQSYNGQNVAPAPVFQGAQSQANDAMNRYGIAMNNFNTQQAGLYGLGGSVLGAAGAAGGFGKLF